jgi:hypothetical protein
MDLRYLGPLSKFGSQRTGLRLRDAQSKLTAVLYRLNSAKNARAPDAGVAMRK